MTCNHEKLLLYSGGELSPNETADMEAHLATCEECRAFLADINEVEGQISNLPDWAPDRDLVGPILMKKKSKRFSWLSFPVPIWQAATAAIVLIFVMQIYPAMIDGKGPAYKQSTSISGRPAAAGVNKKISRLDNRIDRLRPFSRTGFKRSSYITRVKSIELRLSAMKSRIEKIETNFGKGRFRANPPEKSPMRKEI